MFKTSMKRRVFAAAIAATSIVGFTTAGMADGHKLVDSIHFLIPGGAGGGGGARRGGSARGGRVASAQARLRGHQVCEIAISRGACMPPLFLTLPWLRVHQ